MFCNFYSFYLCQVLNGILLHITIYVPSLCSLEQQHGKYFIKLHQMIL